MQRSTLHGVLPLLGLLSMLLASAPLSHAGEDFASDWHNQVDRTFVGPSYWANRLQDWRLRDGRLECIADHQRLGTRTLHLLTHRLADPRAGFEVRVEAGFARPVATAAPGAGVGFLLGVGGEELDYRAAALVHQWSGPGAGMQAGITASGRLFLRDFSVGGVSALDLAVDVGESGSYVESSAPISGLDGGFELVLTVTSAGPSEVSVELSAWTEGSRRISLSAELPDRRLIGGLALWSHPGKDLAERACSGSWFRDWRVSGGSGLDRYADRTFGPIAATQFTVSGGVLKLTAQLMPVGERDPGEVRLEVQEGEQWREVARAQLIRPGFTAPFRLEPWDAARGTKYRVVYELGREDGELERYEYRGLVPADPAPEPQFTVAGFTGNHNNSHALVGGWGADPTEERNNWLSGSWFPHAELRNHAWAYHPDLLFFSGDQVYEGKSPSFADRENIELDYLYKWYLWCWAWGELTRSRPTVTVPDDHDVYQGNLWGEGGRPIHNQDFGGYVHPAEFVKMVERTQTSHLPDPYDPTPVEQGIGVYYTSLTWGRVSFAILEDRKFKTGPAGGRLPPTGTRRPDHIDDPGFDVAAADVPGLELLGRRQLDFLRDWAGDWRGADMKMALSQTVFAGMATHHGAGLDHLIADLDSNGWPQSGRNAALAELRRGFAFHLCGDQHLASLVHHGIEQHGDASWSLCVPSIANFYPRGWWPRVDGANRRPSEAPYLGDHADGFGNLVTVAAVANPGMSGGHEPAGLHDRMAGFGLVVLDKRERTYTAYAFPRYMPGFCREHIQPDHPYPGWPRTVAQTDNYGREPAGHLPELVFPDLLDPVVKVYNEADDELIYALRIEGWEFRPWVFDAERTYTLHVGEPDTDTWQVLTGLRVDESGTAQLEVVFEPR